jgi:Kef-type K+ transport system membrane component KefB
MSLQEGLDTLLVVSLVAALAPLLAWLLQRLRVAQVVLLILGGILVGPDVRVGAGVSGP